MLIALWSLTLAILMVRTLRIGITRADILPFILIMGGSALICVGAYFLWEIIHVAISGP